ncbi:MAG: prfA [Chlamydiales bacterium]|jgi:peptide chain release factor 1|nr:prfA [Chlamydiales bacterium]
MLARKIEEYLNRLKEVEQLLGSPEALQDRKLYQTLTRDHAYLTEVKQLKDEIDSIQKQLSDNEELLKAESDLDLQEMLKEDTQSLKSALEKNSAKMERLLVPPGPYDHCNTILELRAGTGGEEAALFVADCVRMYQMYADQQGWKCEKLSSTPSDMGGFKEYVMVLSGKEVYRKLQYEAGGHRVQRVPDTESQGRVHTSAMTVAVLLEPEDDFDLDFSEGDLRFDTYRASGAGGQHVNTTDSAVRITHLPTGLAVYCQEERSQHKNREKALRLLKARLIEAEMQRRQKELAAKRAGQVGSGDRSERIRTYNFPQNRLTDHRINLTRYNLDRVMEGDLEDVLEPVVAHFHQMQLQS